MIFKNWNPWINGRLTILKTFHKPSNMKNKNFLVDPQIDFFSKDIPLKWRTLTYNLIKANKQNMFFISTLYPNNPETAVFRELDNVWIGLKVTKNNQLTLIPYRDKNIISKKWIYLKNYEESEYLEELFKCTGEEHIISGTFWKHTYPCSKCNGTGLENKYNLQWIVLSGSKKGVNRSVVDDFRINCENTGIPFYYERAWIGDKLIREPSLYGHPCLNKPPEAF